VAASDDNGNVLALWTQYESRKKVLYGRWFAASQGWRTVEKLGADGHDAMNMVAVVDHDGLGTVVWVDDDDGNAAVVWSSWDDASATYSIWMSRHTGAAGVRSATSFTTPASRTAGTVRSVTVGGATKGFGGVRATYSVAGRVVGTQGSDNVLGMQPLPAGMYLEAD